MRHLLLPLALSLGCAGASRSGTSTPMAAATASAKPPAPAAPASDEPVDKIVCTMERPIGSNIVQRVCRRQSAIDAERQAAQDALHGAMKTESSSPGK